MNLAHDDDGIIDLRALKSTPPPPGAFAMASPFGSEPPPAAFVRDAGDGSGGADVVPVRASRAKTIGIAAGAALFLVLGAVGVGFAFRGQKPRAVASAPITQPAPPPVVVAPPAPLLVASPDPAPAAASQPTASSDDTSDDPPAKKTKGAKGRAGAAGQVRSKTSSGSSSPASAPKPAVTKAADPCNCHGDFQCNIRCSANK